MSPEEYKIWILWEILPELFLYSALSGSTADTCGASVYEAFWKNFGVVQAVQKTVEIPHAFLDMVVDKCRMVETVQKLWSLRSWCCPSLSLLTAVSAAAMVSQMSWTTSNSGDGDFACVELPCVVCPGECCGRFRALKCSGYYSANVV